MYIKRYLSFRVIYFYTWHMVLTSLFTGTLAYVLYHYLGWRWVAIPWLPVSLIGTAVAFFVGFKNNQSYERNWEAQKVWGTITNLSRSFAVTIRAYVTNDFTTVPLPQETVNAEVRRLLYRHIAWLYALKHEMHARAPWEHENKASKRQRERIETHTDYDAKLIAEYLPPEEMEWLKTKKSGATQLLDKQSQHFAHLKRIGLLDDFRHVELQKIIMELYEEQGKSERIKNTPFPRQYATSGTIFIFIFTVLLPFGMIDEFEKMGDSLLWLLIPFNLIVTWVFLLMEYTGDVSENPFEGLLNDVPLRSLVRNIEIDIKEMLGEETPEKIKPKMDALF